MRSGMAPVGDRPHGDDATPSGTLQRGLAILDHLAGGSRPTVGELMEAVDVSRSAAYRILGVLRDHGLVSWDSTATSRVTLGSTAILLGMTALTQSDPWEMGRQLMRGLADEIDESVLMAIVDGPEIIYVAHEDRSDHVVGVRRLLGLRRPLEVTSLGKAYAAALHPDDLRALVDRLAFVGLTKTSHTDAASFLADIETCRARGFAIDDGEQDRAVMCVGAAVLDHRELPVSAISVAGPRDRIEPRLDELASRVRDTARDISLRLGCPPTAHAIQDHPKTAGSSTTKGKS
ncbi:IclR family transcriptional regulator [Mariniluteicoccus flavus]